MALDQARQKRLIEAIRSAAAATGACIHIVFGGDWEMISQLMRAVQLRLSRRIRSFRDS
jgi:hypothetical protein